MSFWRRVDAGAHWLKQRHLMPRRLGAWICDRLDLALGMTREEIEANKPGYFRDLPVHWEYTLLIRTFGCEHVQISGPGLTDWRCHHGCEMEEVTR